MKSVSFAKVSFLAVNRLMLGIVSSNDRFFVTSFGPHIILLS